MYHTRARASPIRPGARASAAGARALASSQGRALPPLRPPADTLFDLLHADDARRSLGARAAEFEPIDLSPRRLTFALVLPIDSHPDLGRRLSMARSW